jgi:hypothetical protein
MIFAPMSDNSEFASSELVGLELGFVCGMVIDGLRLGVESCFHLNFWRSVSFVKGSISMAFIQCRQAFEHNQARLKEIEAHSDADAILTKLVKGKGQVEPKPKHKVRAAGRARIKAREPNAVLSVAFDDLLELRLEGRDENQRKKEKRHFNTQRQ